MRSVEVSQFDSFLWCANLAVFFAPGLTHLFAPLCIDPKTPPHIPESEAINMCIQNFWCYYFPFSEYALYNEVPSRRFPHVQFT
jgi:hypothetical protein